MTSWQIYWLTRLDGLIVFLVAISIVLVGVAIGMFLRALDAHGDLSYPSLYNVDKSLIRRNNALRRGLRLLPFVCLAVLFSVLLPTTHEMAVIIVAPKLYNAISANEDLKKIPANVIDLANSWLEELKPKEKSK